MIEPRLLFLHFGIRFTDQRIGCLIQFTERVHLIADRAFRAVCHTECFLIPECHRMLEAAEFAPGRVEFARHAEEILAECAGIRSGQRKMVIAPATGRQRLQLQMRIHIGEIPSAAANVTAVVEYRQSRLHLIAHTSGIVGVHSLAKLGNIRVVIRILALIEQCFDAVLAVAGAHTHDVEENAVAVVIADHLFDLGKEIVEIRRIHAEFVIAGTVPAYRIRRISSAQPLRMPPCHFFIESRGEIHRRFDTDLVRGFDFGTE